jgi:4-amino-4-deoxy-L-arabinose transferase-like glycosyltransferase
MKTMIAKMNQRGWWLAILLLALIIPSWVINIDRVINVDEPRWVIRGANYYYALTHRDFENTIYEYHPGVTNMWIVGTAMHFYFPEYRGIGQGYFDPLKPKFEEFMRSHDKDAIVLVRYSRLIHAGILVILVVAGFLLLRLLVNQKAAYLSMALVAVAPFFLGHSRLLNLEGMLSLFVLISFLGMQVYLNREKKLIYLLLSGAAFGLSQLTKSSSIVVMGLVGLMLFVRLFMHNEESIRAKVWSAAKIFAIWLGAAALVYFILWPGMWVAPGKMISEVYGNAFSYAFQGSRLDVTKELNPDSFSLAFGSNGIFEFIQAWVFSSTPVTWLGLVAALFLLFSKEGRSFSPQIRSTLVYLFVLGGLFILMFGMARGRDSQHYILSSYVAFDVAAGIGWGYALLRAQMKWMLLDRVYMAVVALVILTAAQIGFGFPYAPYYFNYMSPVATQPATWGYGEGMSEAADYLAQKPNAKNMQVYAHNGMGTFSFFFPGNTLVLKRVYLLEDNLTTIAEDMKKSEYLVLYTIVREKQPETNKLLNALEGVAPEKTIFINGIEYIRIYRIADIPEMVYMRLEQ